MAAKTYDGKPCKTCGNTKRYASSFRCVPCSIKASVKSSAKARLKASADKAALVPDKPDRKGWPVKRNIDGGIVHPDPIAHLNLGNAGKFT